MGNLSAGRLFHRWGLLQVAMTKPENISAFFKEVFDLSADQSKQAEVQTRDQCKNGNTSMVAAISALYAAWKVFHLQPASAPASNSIASPRNLAVANHLSWLCNSALSIRKLVLAGFEPQARVLARSFVEAIYQTLVVFYDQNSYLAYQKGRDAKSSKEAYYEVFAKKQSLHKKLQKLEDSFALRSSSERDEQFKQRVHMLEHYSQATHSSAIHVFTSSLQPHDEAALEPTILGRFSLNSENTLLNCSHEICYFCILFEHIAKNIWAIEGLDNNEHYKMFSQLFKLAAKFRTHEVQSSPAKNIA